MKKTAEQILKEVEQNIPKTSLWIKFGRILGIIIGILITLVIILGVIALGKLLLTYVFGV